MLEHPEDTLPPDVGHKVFAYTAKRLFVASGVMHINYEPGYRVTELVAACHTHTLMITQLLAVHHANHDSRHELHKL